jgi:hypothetical protein
VEQIFRRLAKPNSAAEFADVRHNIVIRLFRKTGRLYDFLLFLSLTRDWMPYRYLGT